MEELLALVAILAGFLLRIGIPLGVTALLAWLLHRLDARWQAEAEREQAQANANALDVQPRRLKCWQVHQCPPERRQACPAFAKPDTPCWEVFRKNGHLQERCLGCEVLRQVLLSAI